MFLLERSLCFLLRAKPDGNSAADETNLDLSEQSLTIRMWPWSSGTVEEERSPTPGYTFTLHQETVLPVQAYGILTPRPSTGSVGRSCPGPRPGDESRRVG